MHYKVFTSLLILPFIIVICTGLGISSKLDFTESRSPGIVTEHKIIPVNYRTVKREQSGDQEDFDSIGVVCVSGGCNKTTETAKTDVIVQVKTSIGVDKTKTQIDYTPDVPVVLGTAGTGLESRLNDDGRKPLIITGIESINPTIDSSYVPFNSNLPSFAPSVASENPSILNPTQFDIDHLERKNLDTPSFNINIKTYPPVSLTTSDDGHFVKEIGYTTKGIELNVPYFEPHFNRHYFGESSPPQLVWYSKKTNGFNPVEFRNTHKSTWNPSMWISRFSPTIYYKNNDAAKPKEHCDCKNHHDINTGLQWHQNRRVYNGDPGSQIDDKLAPLN